MVSPEDVARICKQLAGQGIQVWLVGGWGIDALLGMPTRPHKDLDVLILEDDVVRLCDLLAQEGYQLKELWSENRSTIDGRGNEIATAFVLHDPEGRELDVHAVRFDDQGNGVPAWENDRGIIFSQADLGGKGMVAGHPVDCMSAEDQMVCHTGYKLPDYQWRDLDQLHTKRGVEYPAELVRQRAESRAR